MKSIEWERAVLLIALLVVLLAPAGMSAGAQSGSICGTFRDDGYYYYSFYPAGQSQGIPTGYSAENFQWTFGYDIHGSRVWVKLIGPTFNRGGALSGIESFAVVPSCSTGSSITPVVNAVLPLSSSCSARVTVSIDKWNMSTDWQRAIASAAQTWVKAGSKLRVSTSPPPESQRKWTAVDYQGEPIMVNNASLQLAPCEVRAFRASSMPGKYIASLEAAWGARTADLAGWVQPYTRDGRYEDAALLILNDRNIGAGGGFLLTLSTSPSPTNLDVETIALHELGHALGLSHVSDGWAVMNGTTELHLYQLAGGKRRSLADSDVRAIKARFGEATASSSQPSSQQPSSSQSSVAPRPASATISNEVFYAALRRTPGYSGKDESDVLASIPAGSVVQVLSGPQSADGLSWWQVSWSGATGWVADHTGSGKTLLIFMQ